jgi:hypothetical protein
MILHGLSGLNSSGFSKNAACPQAKTGKTNANNTMKLLFRCFIFFGM